MLSQHLEPGFGDRVGTAAGAGAPGGRGVRGGPDVHRRAARGMLLDVAGGNPWDGEGANAWGLDGGDLQVPDDARELDPDRWAYLAELRRKAAGLDVRPASPVVAGRWPLPRRRGVPGRRPRPGRDRVGAELGNRLAVAALLTLAVMSAVSLVLAARLVPGAPALPVATGVTAAPGSVGGLLPDLTVGTPYGVARPLRSVRPAALAVVPPGCACEVQLREVQDAARRAGVATWLVGSDEVELLRLREGAGAAAGVLLAPTGLGQQIASDGLTLVTVHADGVIGDVLPDLDGSPLPAETVLAAVQDLRSAGAPAAQ